MLCNAFLPPPRSSKLLNILASVGLGIATAFRVVPPVGPQRGRPTFEGLGFQVGLDLGQPEPSATAEGMAGHLPPPERGGADAEALPDLAEGQVGFAGRDGLGRVDRRQLAAQDGEGVIPAIGGGR